MDPDAAPGDPASEPNAPDSLACVTCRSRKLKCDRVKPVCTRCIKGKAECIYPESRRKPAFKRRNVKELEERLAQVEGLLREGRSLNDGGGWGTFGENGDGPQFPTGSLSDFTVDVETVMAREAGFSTGSGSRSDGRSVPPPENGFHAPPRFQNQAEPPQELMEMGLNEQLPPFELMEELNAAYFQRAHMFIPIIHPGRYFQAFYSAPHKRPPMCLQYAVWTMASNGHDKYGHYHDIFYKRARQYADGDEMRGYGEHFLSVAHAQAWALIATDEARSMLFTRAAMSSAKAVRLVEMMGLHRLDGGGHEMAPTLAPPRDWTDVEERRRTFWGVFCIDCHGSISTGWPTLINPNDINTNLPASETAFNEGREEPTCPLTDVLKGAVYSTFAGSILICHIHNEILRHVHQSKPNDRPEDVEYGDFWKKHRELDNTLSTAFIFLPESFQLPRQLRNPSAVHTNLNLHAGVICLHHAAIEKIDKHNLPVALKQASERRIRDAAEEIVNIVRLSSHVNPGFKSPMAALSMYCASSVYIYAAKSAPQAGLSTADRDNLEFIIQAMEAIGRHHLITQSFLQQICADVERNGLIDAVAIPGLAKHRNAFGWASSNVPLLARSYLTKHSDIQVPLPGRLPLGASSGTFDPDKTPQAQTARGCPPAPPEAGPGEATNKRRRTSPPPPQQQQQQQWAPQGTPTTFYDEPNKPRGLFGGGILRASGVAPMTNNAPQAPPPVSLPHRASANASPVVNVSAPPQVPVNMAVLGQPQGNPIPFTTAVPPAVTVGYDASGAFVYSQPVTQDMGAMGFTVQEAVDPWNFMPVMDDANWVNMGTGAGAGTGAG
ncbi:binuclear zinc transcription factor [Plectosphaerella plurivora]|uniref:Binuclear zinc transcription factor n=1 Tax=Plectosphaerella plurivora TaxID=936078 RepID=A0A9P8VKR9_9PEZI|nr:binuclear zinc transcription factor [Plectosphaerella plurivora]